MSSEDEQVTLLSGITAAVEDIARSQAAILGVLEHLIASAPPRSITPIIITERRKQLVDSALAIMQESENLGRAHETLRTAFERLKAVEVAPPVLGMFGPEVTSFYESSRTYHFLASQNAQEGMALPVEEVLPASEVGRWRAFGTSLWELSTLWEDDDVIAGKLLERSARANGTLCESIEEVKERKRRVPVREAAAETDTVGADAGSDDGHCGAMVRTAGEGDADESGLDHYPVLLPGPFFHWAEVSAAVDFLEEVVSKNQTAVAHLLQSRGDDVRSSRDIALSLSMSGVEHSPNELLSLCVPQHEANAVLSQARLERVRCALFNARCARITGDSMANVGEEQRMMMETAFEKLLRMYYRLIRVEADGNCFFRAIVRYFLPLIPRDYEDQLSLSLRQRVAPKKRAPTADGAEEPGTPDEYANFIVEGEEDMGDSGVWADHLQLLRVADALKAPIWLIRYDDPGLTLSVADDGTVSLTVSKEYCIAEERYGESKPITVVYTPTPGHYDTLRWNGHPLLQMDSSETAWCMIGPWLDTFRSDSTELNATKLASSLCAAYAQIETDVSQIQSVLMHAAATSGAAARDIKRAMHEEARSLSAAVLASTERFATVLHSLSSHDPPLLQLLPPRSHVYASILEPLLEEQVGREKPVLDGSGPLALLCMRVTLARQEAGTASVAPAAAAGWSSRVVGKSTGTPKEEFKAAPGSGTKPYTDNSATSGSRAASASGGIGSAQCSVGGRAATPTRLESLLEQDTLVDMDAFERLRPASNVVQIRQCRPTALGMVSFLKAAETFKWGLQYINLYGCRLGTDLCKFLATAKPYKGLKEMRCYECVVSTEIVKKSGSTAFPISFFNCTDF